MSEALDKKLARKVKKPTQLKNIAETLEKEVLLHLDKNGTELFDEVYDIPVQSSQQLVNKVKPLLVEAIEKSQSPLKVSLIGSFASGKTISLCSLLKQANLLPRSAQPTSGNVVEIQIVPTHQAEQTQFMQCRLFSIVQLEDMLRDYYSYLKNNYIDELKLLPEQAFLREKIYIFCKDIRNLLESKWTEHNQGSVRFPFRGLTHLAHLYFILLTIRDYMKKYSDIGHKEILTFELPYETNSKQSQDWLVSVTMLDMQWSLLQMSPDNLEQKVAKLTNTLPTNIDSLQQTAQNGEIEHQALRALLPLYKRIVLTQTLDIEDWGDIERISFLDFPGSGSDNRRDVYLCLKELPEAHVNILFFLANKPTTAEAQPLISIIVEAKQHLQQLTNRMLPVINFFDTYAQLPPEIDENQTSTQEQALERVQSFFSTQKLEDVDGLAEGFDVFDESILPQLFSNQKNWDYFLLSPVVSIDESLLSEKEKGIVNTFQNQKSRYGQLLKDLQSSIKFLRNQENGRQYYAAEIAKYKRLQYALEAYQEDGGISFLREEILDKLKRNGLGLIVEDARVPLQEVLKQLEHELIDKLRTEIDTEDLDDPAQDAVVDKEARNRVVELWDKMDKVTAHWSAKGQIQLMHRGHQVGEARSRSDTDYIDPLDLCKAKVLQAVLDSPFWQIWSQNWVTDKQESTSLSELTKTYEKLQTDLEQWAEIAISETIQDTLEKLDDESVDITLGDSTSKLSFADLHNILHKEYLRGAKLSETEGKELKKWFSLTTLNPNLQNELNAQQQTMQEQIKTTPDYKNNSKMPFNENQYFTWSAIEMMKVQRQVILTLQRQVAHQFAFYSANFASELQKQLNNRFYGDNCLDAFKAKCNEPEGIFDRLADVPVETSAAQQEEVLGRTQRREEAQKRAALILDAWDKLI